MGIPSSVTDSTFAFTHTETSASLIYKLKERGYRKCTFVDELQSRYLSRFYSVKLEVQDPDEIIWMSNQE